MGLRAEYEDPNSDIHTSVRATLALAFLPIQEVVPAFEELVDGSPQELHEFFVYVEDHYVGRY